jgi:hypothetical protein
MSELLSKFSGPALAVFTILGKVTRISAHKTGKVLHILLLYFLLFEASSFVLLETLLLVKLFVLLNKSDTVLHVLGLRIFWFFISFFSVFSF